MKKQLIQDIYEKTIEIQNVIKEYEIFIENSNNTDKSIEQKLDWLCKSLKKESNKLYDIHHNKLKKEEETLGFPDDLSLPFFAYGIFKPGQIAYSKIKHLCNEKKEKKQKHIIYFMKEMVFLFYVKTKVELVHLVT